MLFEDLHWCLSPTGHIQSSSGGQQASGSDRERSTSWLDVNLCGAPPGLLSVWGVAYYERLLVDVVQIQREDVIFASHIHAVVVLIHAKDPIVGGVEQEGEVVSGAGRL